MQRLIGGRYAYCIWGDEPSGFVKVLAFYDWQRNCHLRCKLIGLSFRGLEGLRPSGVTLLYSSNTMEVL